MPAEPAKLRTALILLSLWLMVFTSASQTIFVTPILPAIRDALHVEEARLGDLLMVYALALAATALIVGPISDRIGRRRILLLGACSMTIALGLHGLATTFDLLLAARLFAGICGGMLSGAAVSYVGDYFPYERRGWATALVMSGVAFGQVAGIPLGTLLTGLASFRTPFLLFMGLMAMASVLIWAVVPQPPVERARTLSLQSALRGYATLLRNRGTAAACLTYFLLFLSLSLFVVYLSVWLEGRFAVGSSFIASLFFTGGCVSVLTGPWAGALSDRVGRKPLILGSSLGLAVVAAATPYAVAAPWHAYLLFACIMVLFAMRAAPLQALLTGLVPSQQRGSLLSLAIALGQVGQGLGSSLAGRLYVEAGYAACTWGAAAIALLVAAVVYVALPEPTQAA